MNLSDRLQIIADQINKGETMADIGTDHGFLPLYLWEKQISPKAIMADISKGALGKAEDNCRKLYPDSLENGTFDLRLGNGIKVLENGEVDVIVIAGMGGILITEILGDDIAKTCSFKKFILQPRNNIGILRHWLYENGFTITNEALVREGKYICEIITAIPGGETKATEYSPTFQYPDSLIDFKGPLTREYLERALNKEKYILENIKKGNKEDAEYLNLTEKKLEIISNLLDKLGE